jgi:hypothetical protein
MEKPKWFLNSRIVKTLDAKPLLSQGIHPLDQVIAETASFASGDIFEIITPFVPHPMMEKMKDDGFSTWSIADASVGFRTFFCKE